MCDSQNGLQHLPSAHKEAGGSSLDWWSTPVLELHSPLHSSQKCSQTLTVFAGAWWEKVVYT